MLNACESENDIPKKEITSKCQIDRIYKRGRASENKLHYQSGARF